MLAELSIKNFAIIESLTVSFEEGLTVLTGETGAGKSIIIDAIGLLVGGRGSTEFVRYGTNKAEIEGLFLIEEEAHPCIQLAKQLGIEVEDGQIVLKRDMTNKGKSICRINGKLVTLAILREVGQTLVDIHGQNESQDLLNSDRHLPLLDEYAQGDIIKTYNEYTDIYQSYAKLKKKLNSYNDNEQKLAHRLDLIQFQLEEITNSNLKPNEDEELEQERIKMANFEKIHHSLKAGYEGLNGEQRGLDWVGLVMSQLESVSHISEELKGISEQIANSFYLLEEVSYSLRDQLEELEFDPNRLDFIESRLNEINLLKKKYGVTVEEILEYASKIEEEIDEIQNRDTHLEKMKQELQSITEDLFVEAKHLSDLRKKASDELTEMIHRELQELYMEKTAFSVEFKQSDMNSEIGYIQFYPNGIDQVEFYISTNPGEPLKPLSKVASGGELSRIMLALKSIFSEHQGVTSIIFDEVDTGVSGRVAQAIAEKIHRVSVGSQVLCISHLPQVAAMADTHLYISKQTDEERTTTSVHALSEVEKIKEIGRMISGVEVTDLTREHAKELLNIASNLKAKSF
ncbi:DNA repair protein RecN [Bacillus solimangrovi]|uniref:DNA repair protein RecN n=1 Tax=Bacillus solimangrovi TaxID=1305675 RepID=A0A1E5LK82_9BACI|nr:DNA repair protein RecN [Bacillus solimangrovi]OEH94497.1 DNA repair protein RecN [Bacillus solimangrovi]